MINYLVPLVVFLIIYSLYRYFTRNHDYWKKLGIPYIKPLPILGNAWNIATMQKNMILFFGDIYNEKTEDFFGIWMFGTPTLVVKSPEMIKTILVKDFDYFYDRTSLTDEKIDYLSSNFLFFEKNPNWKVSRKPLTQIFTSGKLKAMLPMFNKCGVDMGDFIDRQIEENVSNIEMKNVAANFMTALIALTIFGIETNSLDDKESEFRTMGRQMFSVDLDNGFRQMSYFLFHDIAKWSKVTFVKPKVLEFFRDAFQQTIDHRIQTNESRNDLVSLLIELRKDMIDNGKDGNTKVLAHAMQFFFAGFETTSSSISFLLYECCLNNLVQDKLRAEIQTNIKEFGGITYEALANMKYLDQCICETLRKYPVLPFLDRRCMRDYHVPGSDVIIPKGTPVYIPMFGLHYDPNFFPDPERYDPDRFTDENVRGRHQFCYLPFGQGPHNCIGERFGMLATKVGVAHILSRFEVTRNSATPFPVVFSKISYVLQSDVGLKMNLIKLKCTYTY